MPLNELASALRIAGFNSVKRELFEKRLQKLFVAKDAELCEVNELIAEAEKQGIEVEFAESRIYLGRACAISRPASVAGLKTGNNTV